MKRSALLHVLSVGLWAAFPLSASASNLTSADGLRLEDLRQTRERPLFSITRRPPPKITPAALNAPSPPPPPPEPPTLSLVGVVLGPRDRKVIFTRSATDKPATARIGDDVDGWHIATIQTRAFVLQRDSRSVTISFPSNTLTPAPGAAPAPGGAAAAAAAPAAPAPEKQALPKGLTHLPD